MAVAAADWHLKVEPERAIIKCRFSGLPPTTRIVRGEWSFAPELYFEVGDAIPVPKQDGSAEIEFYPERTTDHVFLRLMDMTAETTLWQDNCMLVAPKDKGPHVLRPDHPGQFGSPEDAPADN